MLRLAEALADGLVEKALCRTPDLVIGGWDDPYLLRWWLIPRNRWFNVYLHLFLRSDDDRALHDHPWFNLSFLLEGAADTAIWNWNVGPRHRLGDRP